MAELAVQPASWLEVLRNRSFRRLVTGQVVSSLGDWAATFALIALVFEKTQNAAAIGLILVLRLLPPVLAAPIGGVLADRYPRRRLMIIASFAQAILIGLVPYVPIGLIYLFALLHEGMGLVFVTARDASVPDLVSEADLETANGLVLGSSYAAIPLGGVLFSGLQVLAIRLVTHVPFLRHLFGNSLAAIFFFDALTFLFAIAMISQIKIKNHANGQPTKMGESLKEGFAYLWHTPKLRALSSGVVVATLGGGILFSIGIVYVHETLHATNTSFGWLAAIWGVGMIIGLLFSQTLQKWQGKDKEHSFVGALLIISVSLLIMALLPYLGVAYLLALPFGAALAGGLILAITVAQQSTPTHIRGRIMAGFQMILRLGLSVGALVIGGIAAAAPIIHVGIRLDGNQIGLIIGSLLIAIGALASYRGFHRAAA